MLKPIQGTRNPGNLLPALWLCRGDFKTPAIRFLGQDRRAETAVPHRPSSPGTCALQQVGLRSSPCSKTASREFAKMATKCSTKEGNEVMTADKVQQ